MSPEEKIERYKHACSQIELILQTTTNETDPNPLERLILVAMAQVTITFSTTPGDRSSLFDKIHKKH